MLTIPDWDFAMASWFDHVAYDRELGPKLGDCAISGLKFMWPETEGKMPCSHRCLLGWHKLWIHGEGSPIPLEILAVIEADLRANGYHEEADALVLAQDAYLRSCEWDQLQAEDVIFSSTPDGEEEMVLRLGVAERNETTKTGMRQGSRLDWPYTMKMLADRVKAMKPNEKVFKTSPTKFRYAWNQSARRLKLQLGPPHSVRHSGPSHDCATGYRTMWQIQRRGRWSSEKSVMRYAKSHTWLEMRAKFPSELMTQGAAILAARPARPTIARE
jgi:hypothetical protein